jgi:drug/metabolite transporter (DMT)-like permease
MKRSYRILLILAYFAIYVVWGTTYLANLYALEGFKPFLLSAFRYLVAGIILLLWCRIRKIALPDRKEFGALGISGILMLVGGSGLVAYAEQYISSGYTAVLVATEPLWFVILDRRRWRQYFSNYKVILGLVIGFAGIALFILYSPASLQHFSKSDQLRGTIIALISSVLWVIGTLYGSAKLSSRDYSLPGTAIQLLVAGLFSIAIATVTGEWADFSLINVSAKAWGGLGFLVIFGSLVAYLAFTWLVTVQPPAIVSTHTYVNPIIALFIGWMVANEAIVAMQLVALGIVLIGIVLAQLNKEAIVKK